MTKAFVLTYLLTYNSVLGFNSAGIKDNLIFESETDCHMVLVELKTLGNSFYDKFTIDIIRHCEEL